VDRYMGGPADNRSSRGVVTDEIMFESLYQVLKCKDYIKKGHLLTACIDQVKMVAHPGVSKWHGKGLWRTKHHSLIHF